VAGDVEAHHDRLHEAIDGLAGAGVECEAIGDPEAEPLTRPRGTPTNRKEVADETTRPWRLLATALRVQGPTGAVT